MATIVRVELAKPPVGKSELPVTKRLGRPWTRASSVTTPRWITMHARRTHVVMRVEVG